MTYYTTLTNTALAKISDALAATDSDVLVGGVEAGDIKKSAISSTVTELALGKFPAGSFVSVYDRAGAIYEIVLGDMNKIIIHCADTFADMDIGAKEIDHWHRQRG